jgi:hypothetical protein
MYSIEDRNKIRDWVLAQADADKRVVAGAVVGSLALADGDKWSDLDLTFGVDDAVSMYDVLADWTAKLEAAFGVVQLFDLPAGPSIYRVFLMPGCLQFDLSFTPAAKFGATGPKFRLLFGKAVEKPFAQGQPAHEVFGYAVHHALRARFCIERGKVWQAEYWLSSLRDYALNLACLKRGLPANNGRGYDALPAEVLDGFKGALPVSLEPDELRRALAVAIEGLVREAGEAAPLAAKVEPHLRMLREDWAESD